MDKNHKGEWCRFKQGLLCQEGYCVNCEIYRERRRLKFSRAHEVDTDTVAKSKN